MSEPRWSEQRELEAAALGVEGERLAERSAEVAELAASQYADVGLEDRLRASVGIAVEVGLVDGTVVRGVLGDAGDGWIRVSGSESGEFIVPVGSVSIVSGISDKAIPQAALGIHERRTLGAVLREVARTRAEVVVVLDNGAHARGRVTRVGADFIELLGDSSSAALRLDAVVCLKR